MGTWIEAILNRAPLPRAVTALLLIAVTNVLLHPVVLVPVFEPAAREGTLYRSGVELFYVIVWSGFAGALMSVLYAYSKRVKRSLEELGEIFGLESEKSQNLYRRLAGIITGKPCSFAGLLLGLTASLLFLCFVVPAMVSGGWYHDKSIHLATTGLVFFDYTLAGSALWMLVSYAYIINRVGVYVSQLPALTMLRRLKVLGVSSLHGAAYFALIGLLAIGYSLGEEYFHIAWMHGVTLLVTVFATLFPILFFFISLIGVHRIILEVKETELDRVRNEYWSRHLNSKNSEDEKRFALREARIRELDNVARWIEQMREWPFDLGILRELAVSGILPMITYILGDYVVRIFLHA